MPTISKYKALRDKKTGNWFHPINGTWVTFEVPYLFDETTTIEKLKTFFSIPDEKEDNIELVTLIIERNIEDVLSELENKLEEEATLISEAVGDIITIATMNDEKSAKELIRKQFVVIDRQDIQN